VCTVADAKIIYPSLGELPLCSATLAGLPAVLYTWLTCKPGTHFPELLEAFMRLVASEVLASRTSETTIAKEGWSSWTRQMLILRRRPGMAKAMCCPLTFQSGHHSIVPAGIAANIALVVAGSYMKWVNAAFTQGSLLLSLRYLVATVIVLSGVMMGAKAYVDANIKSVDVRFQSSHLHPTPRRHKILLLVTCGGDVFWALREILCRRVDACDQRQWQRHLSSSILPAVYMLGNSHVERLWQSGRRHMILKTLDPLTYRKNTHRCRTRCRRRRLRRRGRWRTAWRC